MRATTHSPRCTRLCPRKSVDHRPVDSRSGTDTRSYLLCWHRNESRCWLSRCLSLRTRLYPDKFCCPWTKCTLSGKGTGKRPPRWHIRASNRVERRKNRFPCTSDRRSLIPCRQDTRICSLQMYSRTCGCSCAISRKCRYHRRSYYPLQRLDTRGKNNCKPASKFTHWRGHPWRRLTQSSITWHVFLSSANSYSSAHAQKKPAIGVHANCQSIHRCSPHTRRCPRRTCDLPLTESPKGIHKGKSRQCLHKCGYMNEDLRHTHSRLRKSSRRPPARIPRDTRIVSHLHSARMCGNNYDRQLFDSSLNPRQASILEDKCNCTPPQCSRIRESNCACADDPGTRRCPYTCVPPWRICAPRDTNSRNSLRGFIHPWRQSWLSSAHSSTSMQLLLSSVSVNPTGQPQL